MSNGPATPSKLALARTHSRHISSEGGTEFGTPESTFPTDSPTVGESTRMIGLGLSNTDTGRTGEGSKRGLYPAEDEDDSADVFGGGGSGSNGQTHTLHLSRPRPVVEEDNTLDEVDQFLQDQDEDNQTRESSFDGHTGGRGKRTFAKTKFELNKPRRNDSSTSSLNHSPRSHASDPLLEVLDNDDDEDDEGMELFDNDDDEEFDTGSAEPSTGRRGRRSRRRWNEDESRTNEAGLLEVSQGLAPISRVMVGADVAS